MGCSSRAVTASLETIFVELIQYTYCPNVPLCSCVKIWTSLKRKTLTVYKLLHAASPARFVTDRLCMCLIVTALFPMHAHM